MKISFFFSIVNPAGVNPAISYTWILQIRLILASQTTAAPPHHPYSLLPKSLSPSRGHPHLHPTVNTILALTLSAPLTPSRLSPRPPNNRKTPRNNFPTHPYQQSPATFLEQEDGAGTPSQHPIPSQEQQGFRDTDLATSTYLAVLHKTSNQAMQLPRAHLLTSSQTQAACESCFYRVLLSLLQHLHLWLTNYIPNEQASTAEIPLLEKISQFNTAHLTLLGKPSPTHMIFVPFSLCVLQPHVRGSTDQRRAQRFVIKM